MNQTLQNTGIEMFLREMEKAKPKGVTYHPVTNTKVHPNSRRLSLIEYSIDIEYKGVRRLGFQVAIGVSDDIRAPRVWIDKSLSHINPDPAVLEFLPIGDLPKSIQMFSGRIMGP